MAVKLGNTEASLYLGSTPVAAYLGAAQVYSAVPPEPTTLYYYDPLENGNWEDAGVWWLNEDHTLPASFSPRNGDDLVLLMTVSDGEPRTMRNLTTEANFAGVIATVTGVATFNGSYFGEFTEVIGTAVFNGSSILAGTVTGDATFNDSSYNDSTVNGNATFNDSSGNGNIVTGDATFNDSSVNFGPVSGTATFTGDACNNGGTAGTFVPDPPPSC
jgi:hypothetical protein